MAGLTFADRELFLQTFDAIKSDWHGSDARLLSDICSWARDLTPTFGFEHTLTRDITALSRYLIDFGDDPDISGIARGGLLYPLVAEQRQSSKLGDFGLLDDAYIASFAVHEIRLRLGEPATYSPPSLRKDEKDRAEQLFLEFIDRPLLDDDELILAAQETDVQLAGLAACGLFRRMRNNIAFLIDVLRDESAVPENKSFARAALSYVACEQDAIDDSLGIVGYLDDNFISQMAVDLIDPAREPWLALLDGTVGAWPFLNNILIDDGSGIRPLSEYMVINSALTCPQLRSADKRSTTLILPYSGPVPFLTGFIATLGLMQASEQTQLSEESFRFGQKVLVDNSAIAEFAGYETLNGRRMFKLRQFYTDQGQRLIRDRLWPVSDLGRLLPADSSRVVRGKLKGNLRESHAQLPAAEYLFGITELLHLGNVRKQVLVVMPAALAHEMAESITLHGQSLKDVLPMGYLSNQQAVPFSTHFGTKTPVLVFASDLDAACTFVEENEEAIGLVIVDSHGRNLNKAAAMRRLQSLGVPTLTVLSERAADQVILGKTTVWEWTDSDFHSLLWPTSSNGSRSAIGTVANYEARLKTRTESEVKTTIIPFESADSAFDAAKALRTLTRERGEEHLAELDEAISVGLGLMSLLLRSCHKITAACEVNTACELGLQQLSRIRTRCLYLTNEEKAAIEATEQSLLALLTVLKSENPKSLCVRDLLKQSDVSLACPDKRLLSDLEVAYGDRLLQGPNMSSEVAATCCGAIVPGWFGKDRMAAWLVPPAVSTIHLVMYEIESKWYSGFQRERKRARLERGAADGREQLFPSVPGWQKQKKEDAESIGDQLESNLHELEAIQDYVRHGFRSRVCNSVRSDGTEPELPARLVMFDGGSFVFLTEEREVHVVTHLLDARADNIAAPPDIERKVASELKCGDLVLFRRGSESDVIRVAADDVLKPGVRELSSLWRSALVEYTSHEAVTSEVLHARLRNAGCPLQHLTIRGWLNNDQMIGPQAYKRDVEVIAKVTRNPKLSASMDSVIEAIAEVRSAHLRASHEVAKQIMSRALTIIRAQHQHCGVIDLDKDVVLVRVMDVDRELVVVKASACNQLQEEGAWQE